MCGSLGGSGVSWGVGLFAAGVCGLPGVWGGEACSVGGSVAGVSACSGGGGEARVAGPGAARDRGCVWVTLWGVGREGQRVWGSVYVRCIGVRASLQRRARVVLCRPGGWEEKLAVFRSRGKDLTDACAYLVHLLVGGRNRVLQGWAKADAPEDPVDGVVPAGEGVLWPGGGVRLDLGVGGGDGPDPGHGPCRRPAALDPLGQAAHGQSEVVACSRRGNLGQGAGRGLVARLENAPCAGCCHPLLRRGAWPPG